MKRQEQAIIVHWVGSETEAYYSELRQMWVFTHFGRKIPSLMNVSEWIEVVIDPCEGDSPEVVKWLNMMSLAYETVEGRQLWVIGGPPNPNPAPQMIDRFLEVLAFGTVNLEDAYVSHGMVLKGEALEIYMKSDEAKDADIPERVFGSI